MKAKVPAISREASCGFFAGETNGVSRTIEELNDAIEEAGAEGMSGFKTR